jgi:hypothetical protein
VDAIIAFRNDATEFNPGSTPHTAFATTAPARQNAPQHETAHQFLDRRLDHRWCLGGHRSGG